MGVEGTETVEGLTLEGQADLWLMRDAQRMGEPYHLYCRRVGIIGPAQKRRIQRHESTNFEPYINGDGYDDSWEQRRRSI